MQPLAIRWMEVFRSYAGENPQTYAKTCYTHVAEPELLAMKILISTAGSHGDVLPFIALGREFKARGHDPVLYANPFFHHYATEASIPFVPISTIAPFSALLPKLAAFVHHGGIGSTSQALRAGVPQLIRPVAYDQFDNSSRAVRLGVASEILPNRYTGKTVAATLRQIVADTSLQLRCRQVSMRFPTCNSIVSAADTILDTLDGLTPPS